MSVGSYLKIVESSRGHPKNAEVSSNVVETMKRQRMNHVNTLAGVRSSSEKLAARAKMTRTPMKMNMTDTPIKAALG